MTAAQGTRRLSNVSLAPASLTALLAAMLLGGAIFGAAITLQLGPTEGGIVAVDAAAQPAAMFDVEKFRGEAAAGLAAQTPLAATAACGAVSPERRDHLGGQ